VRAEFCSEVSRDAHEPLGATASRVDHWILFEYRGLWSHDALAGSGLSDGVKAHLRERCEALPHSKLLFIRRTERREGDALRVYVARTRQDESWIRCVELEHYEDVLAHPLSGDDGALVDHPLLLVCTHGKHDRCCARYGRPLYDALREQVDREWVWQCTHVGGDRFAGNLVALPQGAYFGRVGRDDVWPLLDAYLGGRVRLENYRGRSTYTFVVQAAERHVRERTGLLDFDDVAYEAVERTGETAWRVRMRAGGEVHEVDVAARHGQLTYLTCSSETLRHPRTFVATA
jgi:hypothetical protein